MDRQVSLVLYRLGRLVHLIWEQEHLCLGELEDLCRLVQEGLDRQVQGVPCLAVVVGPFLERVDLLGHSPWKVEEHQGHEQGVLEDLWMEQLALDLAREGEVGL